MSAEKIIDIEGKEIKSENEEKVEKKESFLSRAKEKVAAIDKKRAAGTLIKIVGTGVLLGIAYSLGKSSGKNDVLELPLGDSGTSDGSEIDVDNIEIGDVSVDDVTVE